MNPPKPRRAGPHAAESGNAASSSSRRRAGLQFVYAGNLPGFVGDRENTLCPACGTTVIERHGFHVRRNGLVNGKCPDCGAGIPGKWGGE